MGRSHLARPPRQPWLLAAALLVIACGSKDRTQRPAPAAGDASARAVASPIPESSRQLILGVTSGWDDAAATLRLYQRQPGGPWQPVGQPWAATLGRSGAAWGRGLHGDRAPAAAVGPVKAEGDGRSPAGVFAIRGAYGYDAEPPGGAALPYTALGPTWRCVDDPGSAAYNRILDSASVEGDWSSAEVMRRDDELYRRVIEIDHNRAGHASGAPAPGAGSCIFFHVWGGPEATTAGCTAMARADIERLIATLGPDTNPVYVLLPAAQHRTLAAAWGLPQP